jgi:hypothetical protein
LVFKDEGEDEKFSRSKEEYSPTCTTTMELLNLKMPHTYKRKPRGNMPIKITTNNMLIYPCI